MAQVYVTMRIMPKNPQADLNEIEKKAKSKIEAFGGKIHKSDQEPIAFGLKALNIIFMMDESKGAVDPLENELVNISNVQSAEAIDVRRAFG